MRAFPTASYVTSPRPLTPSFLLVQPKPMTMMSSLFELASPPDWFFFLMKVCQRVPHSPPLFYFAGSSPVRTVLFPLVSFPSYFSLSFSLSSKGHLPSPFIRPPHVISPLLWNPSAPWNRFCIMSRFHFPEPPSPTLFPAVVAPPRFSDHFSPPPP